MSDQAKALPGTLTVIEAIKGGFDGVFYIAVPCADYDAFVALPAAVEYEGQVCGKTGWNSDRCRGYYSSERKVAFAK